MMRSIKPSKTIAVINQKNIEILSPFTLSVIFVDIKKEIAIESKVRRELINTSNNVRLSPSEKFPNNKNGKRIPTMRLIINGRLVPKNKPTNKAFRGIG